MWEQSIPVSGGSVTWGKILAGAETGKSQDIYDLSRGDQRGSVRDD